MFQGWLLGDYLELKALQSVVTDSCLVCVSDWSKANQKNGEKSDVYIIHINVPGSPAPHPPNEM